MSGYEQRTESILLNQQGEKRSQHQQYLFGNRQNYCRQR